MCRALKKSVCFTRHLQARRKFMHRGFRNRKPRNVHYIIRNCSDTLVYIIIFENRHAPLTPSPVYSCMYVYCNTYVCITTIIMQRVVALCIHSCPPPRCPLQNLYCINLIQLTVVYVICIVSVLSNLFFSFSKCVKFLVVIYYIFLSRVISVWE